MNGTDHTRGGDAFGDFLGMIRSGKNTHAMARQALLQNLARQFPRVVLNTFGAGDKNGFRFGAEGGDLGGDIANGF